MPAKAEQVSNRFKQRGKDKPYRTREQLKAMRRVKELTLIYSKPYPNGLPHNGLGVKYARYMIRTLAFFETIERRERWLDRYTPWMDADNRNERRRRFHSAPRPGGLYLEYLNQLIAKRHAAGKPPAPDVAPEEYWEHGRWNEEMKNQPPKKAA